MTKEQAIIELKELIKTAEDEREEAHIAADGILCELLVTYGCAEVVDQFRLIKKWYA